MKEYLQLFTPITEALPEPKTQGFAWRNDRVLSGAFWYDYVKGLPMIELGGGYSEGYTHWLDLSKLTTKERAIQALENSMLDDSLEPMTGTEIIEKFINSL